MADYRKTVAQLREDAEWADNHEFEIPMGMMNNLKNAANMIETLRSELCLKCGGYREAHNGACEGCRWK